MKKKLLIIGIVALVAVLSVSGLGYVYMSRMMVAPDNENYALNEIEDETEDEQVPNIPKEWEERIVITNGPYGEPQTARPLSHTEPYYISSDLWRVKWTMNGNEDCNFALKVWKVGSAGSSNYVDTVYGEQASGTLEIDDGSGYYYFELNFEDLYYYQLRISEYK